MKKVFSYVLVLVLIIFALSAARPYWDRYWIGKEIEAAAVYGTKNRIDATRAFLNEKLQKAGYNFPGEDFRIEKDDKNRVTITLKYEDAVSILGKKVKTIGFTVRKTVSEVKDLL